MNTHIPSICRKARGEHPSERLFAFRHETEPSLTAVKGRTLVVGSTRLVEPAEVGACAALLIAIELVNTLKGAGCPFAGRKCPAGSENTPFLCTFETREIVAHLHFTAVGPYGARYFRPLTERINAVESGQTLLRLDTTFSHPFLLETNTGNVSFVLPTVEIVEAVVVARTGISLCTTGKFRTSGGKTGVSRFTPVKILIAWFPIPTIENAATGTGSARKIAPPSFAFLVLCTRIVDDFLPLEHKSAIGNVKEMDIKRVVRLHAGYSIKTYLRLMSIY